MSTLVCIPVHRIKCKVHVDQGRAWTPVEELLLLAVARRARSLAELAQVSNLPHQIVASAVARLMRFRFVVVTSGDGEALFTASPFGRTAIESGEALPFYPKRTSRWVSLVIERATGRVRAARDVHRVRPRDLSSSHGSNRRRTLVLNVTGGDVDAGHETMLGRLAGFVTRGREEKLAHIEAGTVATWSDEFIGVTVDNGTCRDLPEMAGAELRRIVLDAAADRSGQNTLSIAYSGPQTVAPVSRAVACAFAPEDIVIGGSAQRQLLSELIAGADRRLIIHSTFIGREHVEALLPLFRDACARGVTIDLLWGAARGEEERQRYVAIATGLATLARDDAQLARGLCVGLQSTGSHAKLVLADTRGGTWRAAVGSCNWLKSPFQSVEITTVLRHPHLVAGVATAIQRMTGTRGLSDALATEMALLSRDLCELSGEKGPATVTLVTGSEHDALMRHASGQSGGRLFIGMHRLGSTARPGAILPAEAAVLAARDGVQVLYTQPSGPIKKRHARDLAADAAAHGVRLIQATSKPLHGKVLLWGDDDVVATSLNWGSAAIDPSFPLGDIGVHIRVDGIAANVLRRLAEVFPELRLAEAKAA